MARISTYKTDSEINPDDRLIGTDDASGQKPTRNYRIGDLVEFIKSGTNTDGLGYRYSQTKNKNTSGYFSTDNTVIRSVTEIYLSNITKEGVNAEQLFNVIKDDATPIYFKIAKSNDPSQIAYFNITSIEKDGKNAYFKFNVAIMNTLGFGSLIDETDYYFVLDVVTEANVPTKTSDLTNDGQDGQNRFISFADIYTGNTIIHGGFYHVADYDYFVWADAYIINNETYSTYISDTVTLNDGDDTFSRIDVIVINANGTISVIEGIPSEDPVMPNIDHVTQLEVTFVIVAPNSTSPSDIEETLFYNENTQQAGGEADTYTNNPVAIDLGNTTDFYVGSKSIRFLDPDRGDFVKLTTGTFFTRANISVVVFFIKNINTAAKDIRISALKPTDSSSDTRRQAVVRHGSYGFDETNTVDWQLIVIPVKDLNMASGEHEAIQILNAGEDTSYYIDFLFTQHYAENPNPSVIEKTSDIPINDGATGVSPYVEKREIATLSIEDTATVIQLYPYGNFTNSQTPNLTKAFTFSLTDEISPVGESATVLIKTEAGDTEFPTLADAEYVEGAPFEADAYFDLYAWHNGAVVAYSFLKRSAPPPIPPMVIIPKVKGVVGVTDTDPEAWKSPTPGSFTFGTGSVSGYYMSGGNQNFFGELSMDDYPQITKYEVEFVIDSIGATTDLNPIYASGNPSIAGSKVNVFLGMYNGVATMRYPGNTLYDTASFSEGDTIRILVEQGKYTFFVNGVSQIVLTDVGVVFTKVLTSFFMGNAYSSLSNIKQTVYFD